MVRDINSYQAKEGCSERWCVKATKRKLTEYYQKEGIYPRNQI